MSTDSPGRLRRTTCPFWEPGLRTDPVSSSELYALPPRAAIVGSVLSTRLPPSCPKRKPAGRRATSGTRARTRRRWRTASVLVQSAGERVDQAFRAPAHRFLIYRRCPRTTVSEGKGRADALDHLRRPCVRLETQLVARTLDARTLASRDRQHRKAASALIGAAGQIPGGGACGSDRQLAEQVGHSPQMTIGTYAHLSGAHGGGR
jgi:hypothetical protein